MKHIILSGDNKGATINVRPMTIDEVKALRSGTRVLAYTGYFGRNCLNGIVHVKVNGKPKTWKTRPDDVSVPIKYGIYEYTTIDYRDGAMDDENLWFATEEE